MGDRADDAKAASYTAQDLMIVQRDIGRLAKYTLVRSPDQRSLSKDFHIRRNGLELWALDAVSHRCSDRSTRRGSSSRLNVPAEDRQRINV